MVFRISGQAEQDTQEFHTGVNAGPYILRAGSAGGPQQNCREDDCKTAWHAYLPSALKVPSDLKRFNVPFELLGGAMESGRAGIDSLLWTAE